VRHKDIQKLGGYFRLNGPIFNRSQQIRPTKNCAS